MKKLIWISSYPKSGNTWVRYFLANYFYNKEKNDLGFNILNKIDKFPPQNLLKEFTKNGELDQSPYNVSKYWSLIQERMTKSNEDYIFTKNHNALVSIEGRNLTQEKYSLAFIYIVRDPRDIALSYARHYDLDLNAAIKALLDEKNCTFDVGRAEFLSSWGNHILSWQKKEFPVLVLRYEDLLSAPYIHIPRLLAFLGIKTNLSVASLVELTSFENLKRLEAKGGFNESVKQQSFFWRGKSGAGKSLIGANYKELESAFGEIMKSFRYL